MCSSDLQSQAFAAQWEEAFGPAAMNPENLVDCKRFDLKTGQASVSLEPDASAMVETRFINGRPFLLIPIQEGLEVNGIPVEYLSKNEDAPES